MEYYIGAVADLICSNKSNSNVGKKNKHSDVHYMKQLKNSNEDSGSIQTNVKEISNKPVDADCEHGLNMVEQITKTKHKKERKQLENEEGSEVVSNFDGEISNKAGEDNGVDILEQIKKTKHKKKKRKHLENTNEEGSEVVTSNVEGGISNKAAEDDGVDILNKIKKTKHNKKKRKDMGNHEKNSENVDETKINESSVGSKERIGSDKPMKKKKIKHAAKAENDGKSKEQEVNHFEKEMSLEEAVDRDSRTIFVGNLPLTLKKHKLIKFFSRYGVVETVRLRSPPLADTREPKKVAILTKNFHPNRTNINAYICYNNKESAEEALKANGELFDEDHHIRVDMAKKDDITSYDSKKAIFLGNVPFGAEEEELRKIFEVCGEIDGIRIVRDHQSGVGKGFAYINFKSEDAIELALQMDGHTLQNRELRIKRFSYKNKQKKKPNKQINQTSHTSKHHIKSEPNKKKSKSKIRKQKILMKKKEAIKTLLTKNKSNEVHQNKTL